MEKGRERQEQIRQLECKNREMQERMKRQREKDKECLLEELHRQNRVIQDNREILQQTRSSFRQAGGIRSIRRSLTTTEYID